MKAKAKKHAKLGRPTKYHKRFDQLAYLYCLMGVIDTQLADILGICVSSLNVWKKKYPSFMESITRGKDYADAQVALAMYKSGIGSHYVMEDKLISNGRGGFIKETIKRQIPPDFRAQRYWLNSRQPKLWSNKQVVENSNTLDSPSMEFLENDFERRMQESRDMMAAMRKERGQIIEE